MARIIVTSDGDILDQLCHANYGHLAGVVEAVLAENPGLAERRQPYTTGIAILMPDLEAPDNETVTLWE
ncbi:tail protein X [Chromobacterium subtsugae]|uniref:Tail protein X n=1 Tax=Chromobacterium subtsugae TaxID=251747 RepID=A0ABS7FCZ2_9NEIS|nr:MULTISPECIES: tail protein X [Chromobacterium]KUM04210.1 phage tail protein [Chromobacterium subtsugae]KZE85183.1 phage tail protein [Chromobacterium sp. F49]MBW7566310.1 tail protein X [Chromobacterium subtsugae]MBW8287831.1 tail protein X [Chromobacterium subtsugae]WSE91160.1 tail protein X [Chromobacterium subtsugae]